MTEIIIDAWNKNVRPEDTVFHLGDVSFTNQLNTTKILNRLNGTIHLIHGNHDNVVLKGTPRNRFETVETYSRVKIADVEIIMFHYPIKEWDKMHHGSWHLYGHVHGKDMGLSDRRAMDVGVDTRADMAPWDFDELREIIPKLPIAEHH